MLRRFISKPPSPRIWLWIIAITLVIIAIFIWTEIARADTPLPQPTATCANPYAEATIVKAFSPDYPEDERRKNLPPVEAIVQVTVGADGSLVDEHMFKMSGYPDIDQATLRAARGSTYRAKLVDCQPVVGVYFFRASFFPENALDFVVSPAFSPPAAWDRNSHPTSPPNFKELGEWNNAGDVIGVMAGFTHVSLPQLVQDKTNQITGSNATVLASASVRLCGGNVNGWQIAYQQGATRYQEVLQVMDMRLYDAYYYGADAPSDAAIASLNSLCGK